MPLTYDIEDARACWSEVGRRYGAELTDRSGWALRFELSMLVGGRAVAVRSQASASQTRHATAIVAEAAPPPELSLVVVRGYVYPIGRALGIQDIRVGDEHFDDRFIIKASDEALARVWLTDGVRRDMLAAEDYAYKLRGRTASARTLGLETNVAALDAAVQAVAGLANRGARMNADFHALAAKLGGRLRAAGDWRADGAVRIERDLRGLTSQVDCLMAPLTGRRRELVTRVLAQRIDTAGDRFFLSARVSGAKPRQRLPRHDDAVPALRESFELYATDPKLLARRFPRRTCELIARCDPAAISSDASAVTLLFSGLVTDAGRLVVALEAAEASATAIAAPPASGPYR